MHSGTKGGGKLIHLGGGGHVHLSGHVPEKVKITQKKRRAVRDMVLYRRGRQAAVGRALQDRGDGAGEVVPGWIPYMGGRA